MAQKVRTIVILLTIFINHVTNSLGKSTDLIDFRETQVGAVIEIVKSCFPSEKHGVVFVGDFRCFDYQLAMNLAPVVILGKSENKSDEIYKSQIFVVTVESDLESNIQQLKNSKWWNHNGFFIILEKFLNDGRCNNALDILLTVWKMDILRAIYICSDLEDKTMIYTFNPYLDRAPHSWKKVQTATQHSDDRWTLYSKQYFQKSIDCISLTFDKSLDLGGYRGISAGFSGRYLYKKTQQKLIALIWEKFNATLVTKHIKQDNLKVDPEGNVKTDMGLYLSNGTLDIGLHPIWLIYTKTIVASGSFDEDGPALLSQYRGYETMLHKISKLFGWQLITFIVLLSAATVFMFRMSLKLEFGSVILEVMRMWLNSSFVNQPSDSFSRLYLFGVFVCALVIFPAFQGEILGSLMNPTALKDLETMSDLHELKNYKIYGTEYSLLSLDSELEHRSEKIGAAADCQKYVLNSSESVCLARFVGSKETAAKYELHSSNEALEKKHMSFPIRKDWPLTNRLNIILKRYFEHKPFFFYPTGDFHGRKNNSSNNWQALNINDVKLAFRTLVIGLFLAFLCFIFERSH